MGPQVCNTCKINKEPSQFALLRPGKLDGTCRACKEVQKGAKAISAKQPNTNQEKLIA